MIAVPRLTIPSTPASWSRTAALQELPWETLPGWIQLVGATDGQPPEQPTTIRGCCDDQAFYVRFECADRDAWSTYTKRNDPLYREEVVELFLAPGDADPTRYVELEVSPKGVLFVARIHNPTSRRADLETDLTWTCPGLRWQAGRGDTAENWWAALAIPWQGIAPAKSVPASWRANFYRVERPRDGRAEFTAWSPTFADPPDFHLPSRFGLLELAPPQVGESRA